MATLIFFLDGTPDQATPSRDRHSIFWTQPFEHSTLNMNLQVEVLRVVPWSLNMPPSPFFKEF